MADDISTFDGIALANVREALRAYHRNMDMRLASVPAAYQFITECEKILELPYVQGEESRKAGQPKECE